MGLIYEISDILSQNEHYRNLKQTFFGNKFENNDKLSVYNEDRNELINTLEILQCQKLYNMRFPEV